MLKIVVSWWIFIFITSCFYDGNFIPISITTKLFLFIFILMLIIGGKCADVLFANKKPQKIVNNFKVANDDADKLNYFIYFFLLYYFYLFTLLIKLILANGSDILVYVRIIVFSDDFSVNPFFKSSLHLFIHRVVIIPSILVLYIIGLKNHFLFSKNKIFKISIGLLLIDSIIMFGRLNIYYMLLMYFFAAFLSSNYKSITLFIINRVKFKNVIALSVFVVLFLIMTVLRSVDNSDVFLSSIESFVEYNVVGFKIFDVHLWNPNSLIHNHTFGRCFLGHIDSILSIIYRLLVDNTFLPANSENAKELDTFIDIGLSEVKETNAFGTIFFTAFRDFGYCGIILIPFILGFVINRFYLKFKLTNNPKYFVFGLLFVYGTVFSVYQSVFEGVFWPMYLILLLSLNDIHFSNKSFRS